MLWWSQVDDSLLLNIVSKVRKLLWNRSGFRWIFEWGALSLFYSTESIFSHFQKWNGAVRHTQYFKKEGSFFCFCMIFLFSKTECLRADSPFVRLGRPWALSWSLSSQKDAVDPIAVERAETSSPDRSRKHDCDLSAPWRLFENFVLSAFIFLFFIVAVKGWAGRPLRIRVVPLTF